MGLKIQKRATTIKARVITTLIAVFALIAQSGYGFVAGQVANATPGNTINVCKVSTADCTHTDIQSAVNDATAGDTIDITAGTYNLTGTVNIDKALSIVGEPNTVITADNVSYAFNLNADNITVKGLVFTSFSKMTNVGYLYAHTNNVTIQGNIFAGQYSFGDGQVTRGILVGPNSATNLIIKNNYFHSVRQPAYIDNGTTGTISDNFAQGTKGWVIGADSNLAFTNNSWGTTAAANSGDQKNAVDIAIIKNASTRDNYTDVMALSRANNNAAIDNQYEGNLSVAYVDASANASGNGYWNSPFQTVQDATSAVSVGGTIELNSNINSSDQITLTKALILNGNGHTIFSTRNNLLKDNDNNSVLGIQSNGVTVNDLTVDGSAGRYLHGINIFGASNVQLNKVTANNNSNAGININASQVTVTDVTTASNGWYGIDVDKTSASLTVNGTSHHAETKADIYIDDTTKVASIIDNSHQYSSKYVGMNPQGVMYKLTLAAPIDPSPTGFINTNNFSFKWSPVANAVSYEWQGSQSNATNPDGTLQNVTWTGDYQKVQPINPAAQSIGANGTWYWQVRAVDVYGIKGAWSSVWSITVDTTAPAVPNGLSWVDSNNKGMWNGFTNVQKGALSWKDATPTDVDHYIYKFWTNIPGYFNGENNAWTTSDTQYITTTSTGGSIWTNFDNKQGSYYFCIEAVDKAGNTSGCSMPLKVIFDSKVPVITTSLNQSTVSGDDVKLDMTIDEVNPHIVNIRILDSNGNVAKDKNGNNIPGLYDANHTSNAVSYSWDTTKVNDGIYKIQFSARDAANNAAASLLRTIVVDNAAPTAILGFPVIGAVAKDFTVKFSENVNQSEATDSANYFLHNWDGTKYDGLGANATVVYDPATMTATVHFVNPGWSVSAEQNWGVRNIHDLAGNQIAETSRDSTPLGKPEVRKVQGSAVHKNVTWTWEGSDPATPNIEGASGASGVKQYHYQLTRNSIEITSGWTSGTILTTSNLDNGDYELQVYAVDNAGNKSNEVMGTATVDTIAPTLKMGLPTANAAGLYSISGTTDDNTSSVLLKVDGGTAQKATVTPTTGNNGTWTVILGQLDTGRQYSIVASSSDGSGNSFATAPYLLDVATVVTSNEPAVVIISPSPILPAIVARTNSSNNFNTVGPAITQPDPAAVLGTKTAKDNNAVLSASENIAAITPSEQGWKIFGMAWYWWVLIALAVASIIWWIIAGVRRRNQTA